VDPIFVLVEKVVEPTQALAIRGLVLYFFLGFRKIRRQQFLHSSGFLKLFLFEIGQGKSIVPIGASL